MHRKGATRALPPGHPDLPDDLREVGQPVLIPGSMGTASYVLTGVAGAPAFASTCHGAGRVQSRKQAARAVAARIPRARSWRPATSRCAVPPGAGWPRRCPTAYKDVSAVVEAAQGAGLCRPVARLVPLGVVKG